MEGCIHIHDEDDNHVGYICTGGPKRYVRTMHKCPECTRLRPFAGFYQEWYGTTWTCLGCGDSFADGQRLDRPFMRGWRQKAIASGRKQWDLARQVVRS